MEFIQQFKAARRVSTPLVAVRTFDAKSTVNTVKGILPSSTTDAGKVEIDVPVLLWDVVHGLYPVTTAGEKTLGEIASDADTLAGSADLSIALQMVEHCKGDAIVFISNAHLFYKEANIIQGIWNLRDVFKREGNMLVLLVSPGAILPSELVNDVLVMDEPLPTQERLQAIVTDLYAFAKLDAPDADTLTKATDALIGLPAFPSEQAAAMCLDKKAKTLDIPELWERKRQVIAQTPGLSVWAGKETLSDVGGIEAVKHFCTRVMEGNDSPKTIIFIDEIEKAFAGTGTDMSGVKTELTGSMLSWMQDTEMDGLIFLGLPGVSKSALAKALGGQYGTPVINFDLAGMQGSLVGESGANLRAAQKTVNAISGGRVLCIATCNSIGSLPPELRRRFNLGIFFFDAPSSDERKVIWNIYRDKYGIPADQATPGDAGWTGAEIKECCRKAYRLKMTLAESAQFIVPVTKSSADLIQNLRHTSSGKYLSASKPGVYMYSETSTQPMLSEKAFPVQVDGRKMREMN